MEIPDDIGLKVASKMREVMELFRVNYSSRINMDGIPPYCDFCVLCDAETKSMEFAQDRIINHKSDCIGVIFTKMIDPTGELAPAGRWTQ